MDTETATGKKESTTILLKSTCGYKSSHKPGSSKARAMEKVCSN